MSSPAATNPTATNPGASNPAVGNREATDPAKPSGGTGSTTPATTAVAAGPAPRRRALITVGFGLVVVVLLAVIGYVVYNRFYADPTRNAVAGHCLGGLPLVQGDEEPEVSSARIVECSDPAAVYLVEGRLDNLTEEQARDPQVCRGYRHATAIYRAIPSGGTGYVLCLSQITH